VPADFWANEPGLNSDQDFIQWRIAGTLIGELHQRAAGTKLVDDARFITEELGTNHQDFAATQVDIA